HDTIAISGGSGVATFVTHVVRDYDGSISTTSDRSAKSWHLALYKDSISAGTLAGSADTSVWSFVVLSAGTYILAEADSGAAWSRINGPSLTDTFSIAPNAVVSDTFINHAYYLALGILGKWNLLSNPIVRSANDNQSYKIFPHATGTAYIFDTTDSYQAATYVPNGPGFWLKFNSPENDTIVGLPLTSFNFPVIAGWNMIGSIATPVISSDIVQSPPGNISSYFFRYGSGYHPSDTLMPGLGYWVKVGQPGSLNMASGSQTDKTTSHRASDILNNLNSITFRDAAGNTESVYFGVQEHNGPDAKFLAAPPPAPDGALDARFSSNNFIEYFSATARQMKIITLTSASYPLTVAWKFAPGASARYLLSGNGANSDLSRSLDGKSGSMTIGDPKITTLTLSYVSPSVPKAFALLQNYPNPFNPVTVIPYDLPVDARVTLKLYNILGQEIRTLVDGTQTAGYKSVEFNATDLPSGIYYYRITAGSFTAVKKMATIK
ncbi:MAG TPA: T9SS type A sorting domain-containing protein, partial [Bacteroidota bacterium]|nr:T9SS type A sorting domain-containing protein [Bacteroidota bacterium]